MIDCALWYRLCALSFVIQSGWMEQKKKVKIMLEQHTSVVRKLMAPLRWRQTVLRVEFKVFYCSQNCTNIFAYSYSPPQNHSFLDSCQVCAKWSERYQKQRKKIYMQIGEKVNIITRMEKFSSRSRYLALSD